MAEPLGFAHYRDNYTDAELWDMLINAGNPLSVQLSTTVWATARGKLANARESLNTDMTELAEHWQGEASTEFQNRMLLVYQYSLAAEERMSLAETKYLPEIAEHLATAQSRAKGENPLGENLDPAADISDPDEWMHEVKGLPYDEIAALDPQTRTTYQNEHADWRQARHDELAHTVADLGKQYSDMTDEYFAEPAAPPDPEMPGTSSYQQPSTGVFADNGTSPGSSTGAVSSTSTTGGSSASTITEDAWGPIGDEDDIASPWTLPSYDDIDEHSGGLAGGGLGGTMPTGGAVSGTTIPTGSGVPSSSSGFGSGMAGAGGTGSVPGRGPNTTGPVRGGQMTPGRGGAPNGTARNTMQPNHPPGRNNATTRGGLNRPGAGRGNNVPPANTKRSGDEADEEATTSRETKYVQTEDVFSAPFDPTVGPAHEGPKHQREWDKQYDEWRQREEDGES